MHGERPRLAEDKHIKHVYGFRINGMSFRFFLCMYMVFIPSVLAHVPLFWGGTFLRALLAGALGIIISILGALISSHYY